MNSVRIYKVGGTHARSMWVSYSALVASAFLFTLLFPSPRAFAVPTSSQFHNQGALTWNCGSPNTGHCYGSTFWGGANGADTRISLTRELKGGTGALGYFVTTELWLSGVVGKSPLYWVEVGIISDVSRVGDPYPWYFWGDNRPNGGGFSFHFFSPENNGSSTALARITRSGPSTWNVLLRDNLSTFTGTSKNNTFTATYIQVGTELFNNDGTAFESNIYYTNNRWLDSKGIFEVQGNDGVGTSRKAPVHADWYNGQDPIHNSTGGIWYSCITGYGC